MLSIGCRNVSSKLWSEFQNLIKETLNCSQGVNNMHADFPQNRKFPQSGMHRKVFEVALSLSH